ncbi:MAG: PASTA domain-containing protein [Anaerolineae bacterium]|nr:PASTA domain-containing protein [Gemmatimonadaceae bacterium]
MSWRGVARRSLPFLITGTVGFVIAYLIVAFFIFPATIIPTDIKVPAVIGLTEYNAELLIVRAGFRPKTREKTFHASAAEGTVVRQSPAPKSVEPKGSVVSLDISLGQREEEVPTVVGLTFAQAELALDNAGLDIGQRREIGNEAPRGQVLASDPPAGTRVPVPTAVNVIVSTGPATIEMPDVTGQTASQARSLLEQLGFRAGVKVDSFSTMPLNTVVAQTPAAGKNTKAGTRVVITVSGAVSP